MNQQQILKVASTTNVNKLSTAIVSHINQGNTAILQAVGAGAVNQATKSVDAANRIFGGDIFMKPSFLKSDAQEEHFCLNHLLEVV